MNKSFTLIEILVIIVVIGILSAFVLVGMSSITSSANIAKVQAFINSMDNALLLGRVSQWKFDELTTAKEAQPIRDSWGSNNGTLYTGSDGFEKISSNCPSGNCLSFDGSNDYVDCGSGASLKPGTVSWAMGFWFYPTSTAESYPLNISTAASDSRINVILRTNQKVDTFLKDSDGAFGYTTSISATLNVWNHYVFVRNKSESNTYAYINGVMANPKTDSTNDITAQGVFIGAYQGASKWFQGLIDDVRIYNQAIPTSEIQQNYFVGLNNLYKNKGITLNEFNQRIVELKTNLVKNE